MSTKNSKYIVALDQGTSSCRSLLVNLQGQIEAIEQKEFTQHFPQSGWVEHDPEEIWSTQMETFEKLLESNRISPESIIGIGITNQRETTVVWEKITSKPIYNAIVWQDRRTASICDRLKSQGHEAYIRGNTGLVVDAYFSGTKVKWILDSDSNLRTRARQGELLFGTIDSWLIYKMTKGKVHATDYTNASRTMLYNIRELKWDTHILDALDIPDKILPEVQASASHYGYFDYKGTSIPICGVAGDQQSALFGQACFSPGMAKNTYGTGCFMLMNIGDKFISSQNGLLTTLCCDKEGKVCYGLEGSIFIAGAAVQWLRDGLQLIANSAETQQIAEKIEDQHDVVVVPAFAGLGAPYWNMYARGAIFGLSRGSDRASIVKATLDSLAYQTKDVLDAMVADSGNQLSELKVDGGACANNYLMQFQSSMLQCNVERPEVIETTALGAAYLAGITLKIWDAEIIRANRKVDTLFAPNFTKEKQVLLYKQWQKAVVRSMDWIEKTDD